MRIPAQHRNQLALTTTEVAVLSPYCAGTIRRLIVAGKIPAKKNPLNGEWLVPADWVWDWLGAEDAPEIADPDLNAEVAQLRADMR